METSEGNAMDGGENEELLEIVETQRQVRPQPVDNGVDMDEDDHVSKEVLLISMVSQEPPLFNTAHEFYRNTNLKMRKWSQISRTLGWTEFKCKSKWKALRDQYCRELKRRRLNPNANVKWKHFNDLAFLRPFALSRNYRPRNTSIPKTDNHNNTNISYISVSGTNSNVRHFVNGCDIVPFTLSSPLRVTLTKSMSGPAPPTTTTTAATTSTSTAASMTASPTTTAQPDTQLSDANLATLTTGIATSIEEQYSAVFQQQSATQGNNWIVERCEARSSQQATCAATSTAGTTSTSIAAPPSTLIPLGAPVTAVSSGATINFGNGNKSTPVYLESFAEEFKEEMFNKLNDSLESDEILYDQYMDMMKNCEDQTKDIVVNDDGTFQVRIPTRQGRFVTVAVPKRSAENPVEITPIAYLSKDVIYEKQLISLIQAERILYDPRDEHYRNVKRKLAVWSGIASKLSRTVKQCRLKWKALRDQFIREHKRLSTKENIESQSKWKHYDAMSFLNAFIKHKICEVEIKFTPNETQLMEMDLNELIIREGDMLQNDDDITITLQSQQEQQQLNESGQPQEQQQTQQQQQQQHIKIENISVKTQNLSQQPQKPLPNQLILQPRQHVTHQQSTAAAVTFIATTAVSTTTTTITTTSTTTTTTTSSSSSSTSSSNDSFCILTTPNNPNGVAARCVSHTRALHNFEVLNLDGDMMVEDIVDNCIKDKSDNANNGKVRINGMNARQNRALQTQQPITIIIGGDVGNSHDNDLIDGNTNDMIATVSDEFVVEDATANGIMENVNECHQMMSAEDCLDDSIEDDGHDDDMEDNNCINNNNNNNNKNNNNNNKNNNNNNNHHNNTNSNSNCDGDGICDEPPPYTIYTGNTAEAQLHDVASTTATDVRPSIVDIGVVTGAMKFNDHTMQFEYADTASESNVHLVGPSLSQHYLNAPNANLQQQQSHQHEQQQTEQMAAIKSILNGISASGNGNGSAVNSDTQRTANANDAHYSNCNSNFDSLLNNPNESSTITMSPHEMHQQQQQLSQTCNMLSILSPVSSASASNEMLANLQNTNTNRTSVSPMKRPPSPTASLDEDDEYGVFFRGLAMKIRNAKLTPQEFIDLQINILQLIKNR